MVEHAQTKLTITRVHVQQATLGKPVEQVCRLIKVKVKVNLFIYLVCFVLFVSLFRKVNTFNTRIFRVTFTTALKIFYSSLTRSMRVP